MGSFLFLSEGYTNGSPIIHAHQLKGDLLLVYGTGDDNTHYQNCEALVDELVAQNKQFSLMVYPNRTHALSEGRHTRRHHHETLTRFPQGKASRGAGLRPGRKSRLGLLKSR